MGNRTPGKTTVQEVSKPFLRGTVLDGNTFRNSLIFFGTLVVIIFVSFIACASTSFGSTILRVLINAAVAILALVIQFNNGSRNGADAVTRGEILYQKQETCKPFSDAERKSCFHPLKGFVNGFFGTLPLLIIALILALNTTIQMTESGTLPSWMQSYLRRSEIGDALIGYTQPLGLTVMDYIRTVVRISILPYVNMVGTSDKAALCILERLSPLIMLLPGIAYGTGYLTGRKIRTRIHTVIFENDRKRIRRERKRQKAAGASVRKREPEQLN